MTNTDESLKEYTMAEVNKHNKQSDCWLVIGNVSNGAFRLHIGYNTHICVIVSTLLMITFIFCLLFVCCLGGPKVYNVTNYLDDHRKCTQSN